MSKYVLEFFKVTQLTTDLIKLKVGLMLSPFIFLIMY